MHKALNLLASSDKIVIVSVHGAVAGAGMSLSLNADLTLCADNAKFNLAYINIANSPDCGGSWYLTKQIGLRKAMEIALLSETIDADKACSLGLLNKVVAAENLEQETSHWVEKLTSSSPQALTATKNCCVNR